MKIDKLQQRLRRDRPMVTISIRMPEDVVSDLKRMAPLLGFSGYQPLLRAYVGQGLRADLERLEGSLGLSELLDSLRKYGVADDVIALAVADVQGLAEAR